MAFLGTSKETPLEAVRHGIALHDPSTIKTLDREQLLSLQQLLGYGGEWGRFEIPYKWAPPGSRIPAERIIKLSNMLSDINDAEAADLAWTRSLQVALLRATVITQRGLGYCTPGGVLRILSSSLKVAKIAIQNGGSPIKFWSSVQQQDLTNISKSRDIDNLSSLFAMLANRGLLDDVPAMSSKRRLGEVGERNRKGEETPTSQVRVPKSYQPLPDAFVAACGYRALWLIRELGPSLLSLLESIASQSIKCNRPLPVSGKTVDQLAFYEFVRPIISLHAWTDSNGAAIESLPFEVNSFKSKSTSRHPSTSLQWAPKSYGELMVYARMLQAAHAWILLLLSGSRSSEILSYTDECITETKGRNPLISVKTYKLVRSTEGRDQDIPSPEIALFCARQQIRLATAIKSISNPSDPKSMGNHIWIRWQRSGDQPVGSASDDLNSGLNRLAYFFKVDHLLAKPNGRIHVHRFRKTLARLVALSMVNSQMILMDCFGHEDPEMTLISYILSDKSIHADVLRYQRELVILLASKAIENSSTLGGAGGELVREKVEERLTILGKSKLDPKDILELAESLTLEGRMWALVMPGVICALPIGGASPCSKKQGQRNPAFCKTGCDHQILEEFDKQQTDELIQEIINAIASAEQDGRELSLPMWKQQLNSALIRWPDLHEKWASNPFVTKHSNFKLAKAF